MVRHILGAASLFLASVHGAGAESVWWRFEDTPDAEGQTSLRTEMGPTAGFSSEVPSAVISAAGQEWPNGHSYENGGGGPTVINDDHHLIQSIVSQNGPFTIEAFVFWHTYKPFQAIIGSLDHDSRTGWGLGSDEEGKAIIFEAYNGQGENMSVTGGRLTPDQWHHVAIVGQAGDGGTAIQIFLDYVPVSEPVVFRRGSAENVSLPASGKPFSLGAPNPLLGRLDELRITPAALGVADFIKLVP